MSTAFLQGLEFDLDSDDGLVVWESTGLYGRSAIRQWNISSGAVLKQRCATDHGTPNWTVCHTDAVYIKAADAQLFRRRFDCTWGPRLSVGMIRTHTVRVCDAAKFS